MSIPRAVASPLVVVVVLFQLSVAAGQEDGSLTKIFLKDKADKLHTYTLKTNGTVWVSSTGKPIVVSGEVNRALVQGTGSNDIAEVYLLTSDGQIYHVSEGKLTPVSLSGPGNKALVQGTDKAGRPEAYSLSGNGQLSRLVGGKFEPLSGPGNKALVQGTDNAGRPEAYSLSGDGQLSRLVGGKFESLSGPGNKVLTQGTDNAGRPEAYSLSGDGQLSRLVGGKFESLSGPGNKVLTQGTDNAGRPTVYLLSGDYTKGEGRLSRLFGGKFEELSGPGNKVLVQGVDDFGRLQCYVMTKDGSVSLLQASHFVGMSGAGNKNLIEEAGEFNLSQVRIIQNDDSESILRRSRFDTIKGSKDAEVIVGFWKLRNLLPKTGDTLSLGDGATLKFLPPKKQHSEDSIRAIKGGLLISGYWTAMQGDHEYHGDIELNVHLCIYRGKPMVGRITVIDVSCTDDGVNVLFGIKERLPFGISSSFGGLKDFVQNKLTEQRENVEKQVQDAVSEWGRGNPFIGDLSINFRPKEVVVLFHNIR
jgi:hypothetical protein